MFVRLLFLVSKVSLAVSRLFFLLTRKRFCIMMIVMSLPCCGRKCVDRFFVMPPLVFMLNGAGGGGGGGAVSPDMGRANKSGIKMYKSGA
jgi:hypothetical protein